MPRMPYAEPPMLLSHTRLNDQLTTVCPVRGERKVKWKKTCRTYCRKVERIDDIDVDMEDIMETRRRGVARCGVSCVVFVEFFGVFF